MNDLGKGLATVGIWGAVAVIGMASSPAAAMASILAFLATCAVWSD
jgi:hypothetical protein